ncbi:phage virion morphogenesis protein [Ottowia sp.]|uniref:phage virion morphogenesis protein n=1 Tax=Ottowia sp. TaxID=1898956 RepID=UPI003A865A9D
MSQTATDLQALASWLQPLIAALDAPARRSLAVKIARELRRQNQASMRAQTAPDGTPWQARKARIIAANGVRAGLSKARQRQGPMMAKLRQTRYLPIKATPDDASITFAGRVLRIARVHQFGLPDRVSPGGPEHTYAERPLLGLSDNAQDTIKALVLDHLTPQKM